MERDAAGPRIERAQPAAGKAGATVVDSGPLVGHLILHAEIARRRQRQPADQCVGRRIDDPALRVEEAGGRLVGDVAGAAARVRRHVWRVKRDHLGGTERRAVVGQHVDGHRRHRRGRGGVRHGLRRRELHHDGRFGFAGLGSLGVDTLLLHDRCHVLIWHQGRIDRGRAAVRIGDGDVVGLVGVVDAQGDPGRLAGGEPDSGVGQLRIVRVADLTGARLHQLRARHVRDQHVAGFVLQLAVHDDRRPIRAIENQLRIQGGLDGGLREEQVDVIGGGGVAVVGDRPAHVGERPVLDVGVLDIRVLDVGILDVGILDIRVFDVGVLDIGIRDANVFDIGVLDIRVFDVGILDIRILDVGVLDVRVVDLGVLDVGILDVGVFDVGILDIRVLDVGVEHHRATEAARHQVAGDARHFRHTDVDARLRIGRGHVHGARRGRQCRDLRVDDRQRRRAPGHVRR